MRKCEDSFPTPNELIGEDVYDMLYIFDNEKEVVAYVVSTYNLDRAELINELYEEEGMRGEFGRKNYLRGATVKGKDIFIRELMSGEYVLWVGY